MTHLVGIDKGPVMDRTNDLGLDEQYRKWKKWVEVLFKGPLNGVMEGVKCNYVVYWSGDHGMDHWGQDSWWKQGHVEYILDTFWGIHNPQTNQLIAVVELKWLLQGTLSLEDFHTKALRLVTQAGYTGNAKNQVLRSDTIISGLTSDKIRAKIVKKGHAVTLNWVMEIARLEVSTQQHLERMQETAKVNYIQYGKSTKAKKGRSHSLVQGQVATGAPNPVGRAKSLHFHQTLATDMGKADTKKHRTAKLWTQHAKDVERKDTLRRFASRGNASHTL